MIFKTINPKNNKLIKTYDSILHVQLNDKMNVSYKSFKGMKGLGNKGMKERFEKLS